MNRSVIIPVGTVLYHGSIHKLPNGIPNKTNGSWFSTNRNQSVYHALGSELSKQAILYVYKVIRPIRVIYFGAIRNFNNWARRHNLKLPHGYTSYAFANRNSASLICAGGEYDGWSMPSLQRQIMVCRPRDFLQLSEIYRIVDTTIKGVNFSTQNISGNVLWKPRGGNTYELEKITINNISNATEPRANHLYFYIKRNMNGRIPVFVNAAGKEVARGRNALITENNRPSGVRASNGRVLRFKGNFGKNINKLHELTLRKRTGENGAYFKAVALDL